jgi:hypothetical protein
MKKSELQSLIREEIKKTLNEAGRYPINITEIRPTAFNRTQVQVGNPSADMIGWDHTKKKNTIAKIDSIMRTNLSAKRLSGKPAGEPDQPISRAEAGSGPLYYEILGSFDAPGLVKAMQQIELMNITI